MRILSIHSDFIEFESTQKALKSAPDIKEGKKRIEECLVIFVSVEQADEAAPEKVAEKCAEEVRNIAKQVKCERIVLYPFVHLTSKPSSPVVGQKVLELVEQKLEGFEVHQAPFGWYKSFDIRCKGHPLSELSREIRVGEGEKEVVSASLHAEQKVVSKWHILDTHGKLHEIAIKDGKLSGFDFNPHEKLRKFASYELAKVREVSGEPPHSRLMRRLEIADYEPGSDPGNMRYYPKGRLIKGLLEDWVTRKVIKYGAMEVETPIMYDYEHPALKSYLDRFPARQYIVESAKKKFFLRFAACFGQFLIASTSTISYKNLPMRIYELTRYSFRLEKAGELTGLRRLRAFTMPDMHTMCSDLSGAREEFRKQFDLGLETLRQINILPEDFETAIRFTEEFWKENKDFVLSLVKVLGKPVLIEMWNFRYAYFDPKFEFNFVDAIDKASALSTVQIDHENAKRYGIEYVKEDGSRANPYILHCSPSGAIERCIYAMLEKAHMEHEKGKNPVFPLWLSPIQVRLCPVSEKFNEHCEKLLEEFCDEEIRADLDDRSENVQRKIRDAEMEWVPFIIVIGEKELASGKLAVRFREDGKVREMTKDELINQIKEKTKGFPFKPLPLNKLVSKRPKFVG